MSIEAVANSAMIQTPMVRSENGAAMGNDFSAALEQFRQSSDKISSTVSKIEHSAVNSPAQQSLKDLAQLYNYAVTTQVVVRAANQVTSTAKQLMSGQ